MAEKIEYRSIYATLPDDDAFLVLSPIAKAVWYTLKLKLPATGIGFVNPRVLATLVNCSLEQLQAAEAELSPKWIRRDGNLWWIVAGLRFQPALSATDSKHRTFVRRSIATLGSSALLGEFRAAYAEWFIGSAAPKAQTSPSEGPSEGAQKDYRSTVDEDGRRKTASPSSSSPPAREGDVAERLETDGDRNALTALLTAVPRADTWLAELRMMLDGERGPALRPTPAQLGVAIGEYVANGDAAKPSLAHFKGYVRRAIQTAAKPAPVVGGAGNGTHARARAADSGGDAALLLTRIRELAESAETQGSGRRQFIRRDKVASLGAAALRAYEAIGGADRILATKPEHWGLLTRDFAAALSAAGTAA